ncbi:S9 family peptidase [Sphingobacterium sp. lm-10]|uniref:S9 family peptidase n=1 Tax=Sphingobacterium sp. lm-10 TaxID=2944904 RepID=UPI0020220ED0|nr:S9 family peptidase [Sphingobacterium sp. lm-10]MCL7987950.1 S9 family peptidase [Sphingobacterium sp. lm-10]
MTYTKNMLGAFLVMSITIGHAQNLKDVPQRIKRTKNTELVNISSDRQALTAENLWKLGRVSGEQLTPDGKQVIYGVAQYNFETNSAERNLFAVPVLGGSPTQLTTEHGSETVLDITQKGEIIYLFKGDLWKMLADGRQKVKITETDGKLSDVRLSPDKKHILYSKSVLVNAFHSPDKHKDLPKSDVYVYDDLDYRHWDTFNDGRYTHPFVASYSDGKLGEPIDLLEGKPYYSPQAPFGGAEDFAWSPDSKAVLYVTKKKSGKEYALSTNTDIYRYELATAQTSNLTEGLNGYDTSPTFSPAGNRLAWLSMKTDGYEADKNDIILQDQDARNQLNLTAHWDETVNSFVWSKDGKKIYFTAPVKGTVQLFEVTVPTSLATKATAKITQISEGEFDVTGIVGEYDGGLVVTSTRLTRATEIYRYDFKTRQLSPITKVNDAAYAQIAETPVKGRFTKATDGEDLFSWVVYPPNFDPTKKYPTLLYCQGGPQSAVTQSYSLRWNLQLIASQGYIVIAPNRRGMPGWGTKWNEDISGDWGGQPIRDYLSAIDDLSKESYVDTARLGAVGASYGGYSVFMLAGVHEGRFKSFISHCGLFNMTSWYGTTEELFFANKDLGGPYWDPANEQTYTEFNPIKHIDKWDAPIMVIQGGKDFRVPVGQGLEAFQAAQLKGIKSRLVYLPGENHWVVSGHNAQVWQREFFRWLEETL